MTSNRFCCQAVRCIWGHNRRFRGVINDNSKSPNRGTRMGARNDLLLFMIPVFPCSTPNTELQFCFHFGLWDGELRTWDRQYCVGCVSTIPVNIGRWLRDRQCSIQPRWEFLFVTSKVSVHHSSYRFQQRVFSLKMRTREKMYSPDK